MADGQLGLLGDSQIEAAFWRFHRENPQVYDRLVQLARTWRERRGRERVGMKMLFEVLRWEVALATTGDAFKLNNNYTSYYARLVMERNPDLDGLFQLRRLHAREPFGQAPDPDAPRGHVAP